MSPINEPQKDRRKVSEETAILAQGQETLRNDFVEMREEVRKEVRNLKREVMDLSEQMLLIKQLSPLIPLVPMMATFFVSDAPDLLKILKERQARELIRDITEKSRSQRRPYWIAALSCILTAILALLVAIAIQHVGAK